MGSPVHMGHFKREGREVDGMDLTIYEIQRIRASRCPNDKELLKRAYARLFGEEMPITGPSPEEAQHMAQWGRDVGIKTVEREALAYTK